MNDQQLEHKVQQDAARIKKDIDTLVEDSATRLSRFESSIGKIAGKTKEEITAWADDGASHLSKGFVKLAVDAKETVGSTAETVRKDVGHRLNQYNEKAKEIADHVPDGFGKKVARYPWVAITIGLLVGFLLGMIFKPTPQTA